MAQMNREQMKQEHRRLVAQISEWNANRLDLFELSLPNEVNFSIKKSFNFF